MSSKLTEAIYYVLEKYPHKEEMSNARLTKIIYLSDWRQALKYSTQITDIEWVFDNHGPFVWDVKTEVEKYPNIFLITPTRNPFGNRKLLFEIKNNMSLLNLTNNEKASIDYIIEITQKLSWNEFIKLVYSTYPIAKSERYSSLNLLHLANEYKTILQE